MEPFQLDGPVSNEMKDASEVRRFMDAMLSALDDKANEIGRQQMSFRALRHLHQGLATLAREIEALKAQRS